MYPKPSADQLYAGLVAKAGLFEKAFYGHKKTRKEAKRLDYLWKLARKLAGGGNDDEVDSKGSSSTKKPTGLPGAKSHQGFTGNSDPSNQSKKRTTGPRSAKRTSGIGEDNTSEHHSLGDGLADQDGGGDRVEPIRNESTNREVTT